MYVCRWKHRIQNNFIFEQVNLEARRRHREEKLPPLKNKSTLPSSPSPPPTPPEERKDIDIKEKNGKENENEESTDIEEEEEEESEIEEEESEKEDDEEGKKDVNGAKKISDFFKKFQINKTPEIGVEHVVEHMGEQEVTSPNRDQNSRAKKKVTFFGRNNNMLNKKTSNDSRQTSLIDEKVVKNVDENSPKNVDNTESDDSTPSEDKIRKISEEPTKTSTVMARIGSKKSAACLIL